jgi:hypothetical protein
MQIADASVEISALGGVDDYDFFVGSLNSSGNWDWLRTVGNEFYNLGNLSLSASNNGLIYLAGSLNDAPIEFGTEVLQTAGANSSFVARLLTDGSFLWGFPLPELYSFQAGSENILHACGKFSGSVAFGDTTLSSTTAASDVYHARIQYVPDLPSAMNEALPPDIVIFPNPFINEIAIQTADEIELVQIFDATGRMVEKFGNSKRLNLVGLDSGNYIIKIVSTTGAKTAKLVKF